MFTGIIEEIGVVSALIKGSKSLRLSVYSKKVLTDLKVGDSISVNGACLTAVEVGGNHFSVDAVDETLRRSSLTNIRIGDHVNLERALTLSTRLGGHMMTGHIDCLGEIKGKIARDQGFELIIAAPGDFFKYIVPKGSVGVEGVSLTIASISPEGFHIAVIPHTIQTTTLGKKNIGEKVNLEADIISKYLEGLFQDENVSQSDKMMMNAGFMPLGIWEN